MVKDKKKGGNVKNILSGNFLVKGDSGKLFSFIVYVAILLMALITNTYIAESRTRTKTANSKKINELQIESLQLKSAIMQNSKQSVLAKRLAPYGIKETTEPLKRITME